MWRRSTIDHNETDPRLSYNDQAQNWYITRGNGHCQACGSAFDDKGGCINCQKTVGSIGQEYGTIKRGTQKFELGSPQDKLLHAKDIDHSHVKVTESGKSIKRYGENYDN